MSELNREPKPTDETEPLNRPAGGCACGSGCDCQGGGSACGKRWIIGVIVLVAAGVLAARALMKNPGAASPAGPAGYAARVVPVPAPVGGVASTDEVAVVEIGALNDLNLVAVGTDAVFVYLPATNGGSVPAPTALIRRASKTIESQARIKIGIFSLKPDSPDYAQVVKQLAVPGVMVMVKGRGMAPVSGDLTEAKLVQGFVAASSAGGCGPASGGCGPASAGCQ